jgi:hypothetical protein
MSHIRIISKLQQEYLVAEKKERAELTKEYVDENYNCEDGFD